MTNNNNNYKLPELPPLEDVLKNIRSGGASKPLEDKIIKPENSPIRTREIVTECPILKKKRNGDGEIKILVGKTTSVICPHALGMDGKCSLTGVPLNHSIWTGNGYNYVYDKCPFADYKA